MDQDLGRIRLGQKLVIYSLLLSTVMIVLWIKFGPMAATLQLPVAVMSMVGAYKICSGFRYSQVRTAVFVLLMLAPSISLIVMGVLSVRSTAALRQAGLKVGFLGAQ